MKRTSILLLAASGLALETLALLQRIASYHVLGILDDNRALHGTIFGSTTVLGGFEEIDKYPSAQVVICVGSGPTRCAVLSRLTGMGVAIDRFATLVDPSATTTNAHRIGRGSIVFSHVSLSAGVDIGEHVVIMPNAVVTHGGSLANFVTVCAGASFGGDVRIRKGAYIGMNACVRQGLVIGENATLGMGAALICDLPAGQVWAGCPARAIRNAGMDDKKNSVDKT